MPAGANVQGIDHAVVEANGVTRCKRKTSARRLEIRKIPETASSPGWRAADLLSAWHLCNRSDGVALRLGRSCLAHLRTRIDLRGIRSLHPGCWFARQHKFLSIPRRQCG